MAEDRSHQCDAGLNCPLKEEIGILRLRVKQVIKGIRGISRGDDSETGGSEEI